MSGFVKTPTLEPQQVRCEKITSQQMQEARERLGQRVSKYLFNRKRGMPHQVALEEAVKP